MLHNIAQIEECLSWDHCEDLNEARSRFSKITNILNKVIMERQRAKREIISCCASYQGQDFHKLSWDNKLVRLAELSNSSELINEWQNADTAYRTLKLKQDEIYEDLLAVKKIMDVLPRN